MAGELQMSGKILVINCGSSSIKFGLYGSIDHTLTVIKTGEIVAIGAIPRLQVFDANGVSIIDKRLINGSNHAQAMSALLDWGLSVGTHTQTARDIVAIGHRVVHGGGLYDAPVRITEQVLEHLDTLDALAPLHESHNVAAIRILAELMPNIPQVACFDTSFHCTLPKVARQFALPQPLYEQGVKRYGFHGLSYEYMAECLPDLIGKDAASANVIVAHLGNGASMCAMQGGRSVATTMGFTALDGLPMATRCGDLDPGVILYLLEVLHMSSEDITELLYKQSGLLGLSGISGDMQTLLKSDAEQAREAIDFYIYRINRELGALTAILGGLDALVFTAGIGEHCAAIRSRVCKLAGWAGIRVDAYHNERHSLCISAGDSPVTVWAIPTKEEWMIARHTQRLLS